MVFLMVIMPNLLQQIFKMVVVFTLEQLIEVVTGGIVELVISCGRKEMILFIP